MLCSHVQTQLRELHKEQHQDIAEHLQELKQLLISSREPIAELTYPRIERDLEVPLALQMKFVANIRAQEATNKQGSNLNSAEGGLLVKDGLEAFFSHFNAVRDYASFISTLLFRSGLSSYRSHELSSPHEEYMDHGPNSWERRLEEDPAHKPG